MYIEQVMAKILKNKSFQNLLKITFSLVILYFLITKNNIDFYKIQDALLDMKLVSVLMLLVGLALVFNSYRWMKVLMLQRVPTQLSAIINFSMIGIFFNFLLPSNVGGDVVKAILAANKWGEKKTKILLSVLVDRVFGLLTMMSLSILGYIIHYSYLKQFNEVNLSVIFISIAVAVCCAMAALLYFGANLSFKFELLNRVFSFVREVKKRRGHIFDLISCKLMSYGSALCHILFLFFVFSHYGKELPFSVLLFCVPIATVLMAVPLSPGGIGVGQAIYFYMFNIFEDGLGEVAFFAVTILQVIYFIWAIIGSVCFAFTPMTVKEVQEG